MYRIEPSEIKEMAENGYYLQKTDGRRLSDRLHSHTFYEMIFVVSGSCVHELDGACEELSEGCFVFIVPEVSHRFISQSEDCDVIGISVTEREIDKIFSFLGKEHIFAYCSVVMLSPEQRLIVTSQYESMFKNGATDYASANRIFLTQLLLFRIDSVSRNGKLPSALEDVIRQMQSLELAREGVSAFLRISCYSHSQLCRITRKYFDVTPTEYVNRIRINHAYRLILDTDMSYESICAEVGFESFSYFCKLFKKQFSCSVARLRKESIYIRKSV